MKKLSYAIVLTILTILVLISYNKFYAGDTITQDMNGNWVNQDGRLTDESGDILSTPENVTVNGR